jgi:hypothetical protein
VQINHPETAPDYYTLAGSVRGRTKRDAVLLAGDENSPDNFIMRFGDNDVAEDDRGSPRHRHNFEQIRYPLRGDHPIGPDLVIPEGWVGYFPEGAFYGPYGFPTRPLTMLVVQFGGPSGTGFESIAQGRQGFDELLARGGRLDDGLYLWEDEEGGRHAQDAYEAKWEAIFKKKIAYPAPRYHTFILMNPASFAWMKDPARPGVGRKLLGTFTEREVRVGLIQLDRGASFTFGLEPAGEMLFLQAGAVAHDGVEHETRTAFATAAGDGSETVTASEDSELFYLKLPTF